MERVFSRTHFRWACLVLLYIDQLSVFSYVLLVPGGGTPSSYIPRWTHHIIDNQFTTTKFDRNNQSTMQPQQGKTSTNWRHSAQTDNKGAHTDPRKNERRKLREARGATNSTDPWPRTPAAMATMNIDTGRCRRDKILVPLPSKQPEGRETPKQHKEGNSYDRLQVLRCPSCI
jgi:hypothetical protein